MSTFKVSLEQIATSAIHPNADRLSLCTLEGMTFQFVTGRDQFKPGDWVIYYPVDSILPAPLIERLGLTGKLAGKEKNRIKTVRLRDAISQGVVEPMKANLMSFDYLGKDVTEIMGVIKWDPEPVQCHNADLIPIGTIGLSKYDIEGADRYPDIIELLMDQKVSITEKVEGSNFGVTVDSGKQVFINQREFTIKPKEGSVHSFWRVAAEQGLIEFTRGVAAGCSGSITSYGEYLGPGVQGNIYGLKANEVLLFDIKASYGFMNPGDFLDWVQSNEMKSVPIIAHDVILRDWLAGRTVQEASNGISLLNPAVKREGIVIRPMVEQRHPTLGRLILKQRSPDYLANSNL